MSDFSTYDLDAYKRIFRAYFEAKSFVVEEDPNLGADIKWRPHLSAMQDDDRYALEIRFDSMLPGWMDVEQIQQCLPGWKLAFALADEVSQSHDFVIYCVKHDIYLFKVVKSAVMLLHDPDAPQFIETRLKFPKSKKELTILGEYQSDVLVAKNIYEIGHPREGLGVIGRVLEQAIDDFLLTACAKRKIPFPKGYVLSKDYDGKIQFLYSPSYNNRRLKGFINDRQRANFLSVKWDRNVADHPEDPAEVAEVVEMASGKIDVGIRCIELMKRLKENLT